MNFIVSSQLLLKNLQSISGVLNYNHSLPILENFLLEFEQNQMVITASDLDSTMTTHFEIMCESPGKIAIPAKLLLETLKTFPETPLSFNIDEKTFQVEIATSDGKYSIAGFDASEFPKTAALESPESISLNSYVLSSAINKTIFATGNDELRPAMNGVFCQIAKEHLTFAATDAHKLVRFRRNDIQSENEGSFILPKKPLNLIKNILASMDTEVRLDYNKTNAFFSFDNYNLICRLIDAKYPNYEAVIPTSNPNILTVDRLAFLSSIRRVSIFSNKTTHQVRIKIVGNELTVSAEDFDFNNAATERLSCEYTGEDMEIGFNSRFIIEMLNNLDTDQICIEMSQPNRAGILLPVGNENEGEDILMLVMPVMINS
jgi:DNA polymerase III subunit beta